MGFNFMVNIMGKRLVYGVGINDADYHVKKKNSEGKTELCPFYICWVSMIERCYYEFFQKRRPSYIGCSVCDEWLTFSKFKAWMQQQDWKGKQLDKDIINPGNKVYSPESCAFVDNMTNNFIAENKKQRGKWPLGACFFKPAKKFISTCKNPFTKKTEYLGYFVDPQMAHEAWKARKAELAIELSKLQSDPRVSAAILNRYAPS